jgi:hypothetical protein
MLDYNPTILKKLEDSKYQFHLTGSHYFQSNTIDSDIDLFTERSNEIEAYLTKLGFNFITTYDDVNTKIVARIPGIDIQLVENALLKIECQRNLKQLGYQHPNRDQWNMMYRLIDTDMIK